MIIKDYKIDYSNNYFLTNLRISSRVSESEEILYSTKEILFSTELILFLTAKTLFCRSKCFFLTTFEFLPNYPSSESCPKRFYYHFLVVHE